MALLIKDRRVTSDSWQWLKADSDASLVDVPLSGDVIVPCRYWLAHRDVLLGRPSRLGIWLSSDDEPASIAEDLRLFAVIAVHFLAFTDGRGYSIARLLRERYGWRGELRAVGDIQRDQLFYLSRCGFDAFALRDGEEADIAMRAFADFSEAYQTSADRPVPLFRRRAVEHEGGEHAFSV
jgi:uncharacterized protein (DUF934 family)